MAGRLARQHAGERLPYSQTTSDALAARAAALLDSVPDWPPIQTDGAHRAAELIAGLLPPASVALAA